MGGDLGEAVGGRERAYVTDVLQVRDVAQQLLIIQRLRFVLARREWGSTDRGF